MRRGGCIAKGKDEVVIFYEEGKRTFFKIGQGLGQGFKIGQGLEQGFKKDRVYAKLALTGRMRNHTKMIIICHKTLCL